VVVVVACGTTLRSLGLDVEMAVAAVAAFATVGVAVARDLVAEPAGGAA
jgi:hypothetical protein